MTLSTIRDSGQSRPTTSREGRDKREDRPEQADTLGRHLVIVVQGLEEIRNGH